VTQPTLGLVAGAPKAAPVPQQVEQRPLAMGFKSTVMPGEPTPRPSSEGKPISYAGATEQAAAQRTPITHHASHHQADRTRGRRHVRTIRAPSIFRLSARRTGSVVARAPAARGCYRKAFTWCLSQIAGWLLLDQHAAHERILFEQMLTRVEQGGQAPSQRLLLPETLELSVRDAAFSSPAVAGAHAAGRGFERVWRAHVPPGCAAAIS